MSHAQTKYSQEETTLFQKETLLGILQEGRKNLEQAGSLQPVLIIELSNGKGFISFLEMPDDTATKYRMFQTIGKKIHAEQGTIKDAVLLTESWIVEAMNAPDATKYMPSQHPCRKEAIVLVGRNVDQTRSAIVIQTFTKDEHNAPVWSEPQVSIRKSNTKGMVAKGLLDALFDDWVIDE